MQVGLAFGRHPELNKLLNAKVWRFGGRWVDQLINNSLVRTNLDNKLQYIKVRDDTEEMPLPQPQHYNIGLGLASTRTNQQ